MAHYYDFFASDDKVRVLKNTLETSKIQTQKQIEVPYLQHLIMTRRRAFEYAYESAYQANDNFLTLKFLRAAIHFEKTVQVLLKEPAKLEALIATYYDDANYIHVADRGTHYSYTYWDSCATFGLGLGLFLSVGAAFAIGFGLSTVAPGILCAVALTILVPTSFYHFCITDTNKDRVKEQEETVFDGFRSDAAIPLDEVDDRTFTHDASEWQPGFR